MQTSIYQPSQGDLLALVETQRIVIDRLGRNAPFEDFLRDVCDLFGHQIQGSMVSILLPTEDHTELAAGMGLDLGTGAEKTQLIPIAEGSGTSGTAAFRRKTVISSDIPNDALWDNWRDQATAVGLQACWSIPLERNDELLGVLAVLWNHPKLPEPREMWLHEEFASLTASVIERYRSQQSVSQILANERRAMAQDLHDDPIQAITAVNLRLQRLASSVSDDQKLHLNDILAAVNGAIERMRSMVFDLHPPTLDDEGLASAIELYLYERIDPLDIQWTLHDHLKHEPSPTAASLAYSLAREALANVASHSQASAVVVTIGSEGGGLQVTVSDDGIGCDVSHVTRNRPGHLGTVSSRHLAERASGRWQIESTPGHGTTVQFWIPSGRLS